MATRPVTVRLPRFDEIIPPTARAALLRQIALLLIGRIKRRTKAGLDVNGRAFTPYSTSYSEQRRKAGRQTSPDLWLSGAMLNSMAILESTPNRAVIGFQGAAPALRFQKRARATTSTRTVAGVTRRRKVTHTFAETNRQVANALKAYWNDQGDGPPRRHFFGLSQEDKLFATTYALRELTALAGRYYLHRAAGR